jgi:AcrR family transcriptional regulator
MSRKYELKARAERQEETRRRITEATVELHRTVGPARTTIAAIAERAGVQRLTVYRHFPDERTLFAACSAHFIASDPPPDLATFAAVTDPQRRLRRALTELYGWYDRQEDMLANVARDAPALPALAEVVQSDAFREALAAVLASGLPRRRLVRAALRHAVAFDTWRSLERQAGLKRADSVALMARLVAAAGE